MGANEDTVRRGYEAFGRGDMDTLRSIMTPDVVQSVPGKSQVSGDHKGVDNVLKLNVEDCKNNPTLCPNLKVTDQVDSKALFDNSFAQKVAK